MDRQTAGEIWRGAEGFGMSGVRVDGNDARAVFEAVAQAAEKLPGWDHLGVKLKDGLLIMILVLIWTLPGIGLGLPAELASGEGTEAGITGRKTDDALEVGGQAAQRGA